MSSRSFWGRALAVLAGAGLCCALLFPRPGAHARETRVGAEVLPELKNGKVLLFEQGPDAVWIAAAGMDDTWVARVDPLDGRELSSCQVETYASWAALRGGTAYLRDALSDTLAFRTVTAQGEGALRTGTDRVLDVRFADLSPGGALYTVSSSKPETLSREQNGLRWESAFGGEIEFLAVIGESPAVFSGSALTLGDRRFTCEELPFVMLSETLLVDVTGALRRLENGAAEEVFSTGVTPYTNTHVFALDGTGRLLSADGNTVTAYAKDGTRDASVSFPGEVLAVCPCGALYEQSGSLFYAPWDGALGEAAEPTPSPSPSPAPTPTPVPDAPVWQEGSLYVARPGTTVDDLRALLFPEPGDIRDETGAPVISGRLCTGYTANGKTVVVLGDCTGDGGGRAADLREALRRYFLPKDWKDPFLRAADMDGDGSLGPLDLLALRPADGEE